MAEFVQQSVEEMLPELEQMARVGLFTQSETRYIDQIYTAVTRQCCTAIVYKIAFSLYSSLLTIRYFEMGLVCQSAIHPGLTHSGVALESRDCLAVAGL